MMKFEIPTTYSTVPRVSITSKILRGRVGRHAEMLRRILRFMQLSEAEIEEFIYQDLSYNFGLSLFKRGFALGMTDSLMDIGSTWTRQLHLGSYGKADIVGFYRLNGCVCAEILELKAREIKPEDFEQISRYQSGLFRFIRNTLKGEFEIKIHLHLIGTSYDGLYLQNICPVSVSEIIYGVEGFFFNYHKPYSGWHIPSNEKRVFNRSLKNIHLAQ